MYSARCSAAMIGSTFAVQAGCRAHHGAYRRVIVRCLRGRGSVEHLQVPHGCGACAQLYTMSLYKRRVRCMCALCPDGVCVSRACCRFFWRGSFLLSKGMLLAQLCASATVMQLCALCMVSGMVSSVLHKAWTWVQSGHEFMN